jgi:hypothetical protein
MQASAGRNGWRANHFMIPSARMAQPDPELQSQSDPYK